MQEASTFSRKILEKIQKRCQPAFKKAGKQACKAAAEISINHFSGIKSSGRFSSWELSRDVRLSAVSRAVSPTAAS